MVEAIKTGGGGGFDLWDCGGVVAPGCERVRIVENGTGFVPELSGGPPEKTQHCFAVAAC